jgi:hypothetical protein
LLSRQKPTAYENLETIALNWAGREHGGLLIEKLQPIPLAPSDLRGSLGAFLFLEEIKHWKARIFGSPIT